MNKLAIGAVTTALLLGQAVAGEVWLTVDHARPYDTGQSVGSIVVGNPSIADVDVRSANEIVLFGKRPGATNITLYDKDGEQIRSLFVNVRNPTSNRVTLHAGATRYSFNCTDVCEQIAAIGDGTNESRALGGTTLGQAQSLASAAAGASEGVASVERVRVSPVPASASTTDEPTLSGAVDPQS